MAGRLRSAWSIRAVRLAAPPLALLPLWAAAGLVHHVYFDRSGVPELEPFIRFEPPTIGAVYDARGKVLIDLAREHRRVVTYDEVPLILRQAILAAEDKNFFTLLDGRNFPIPVMGKTGTTSDFRDALFVGSATGRRGSRWRFGSASTTTARWGQGRPGRTALPIFREIMLRVYQDKLVGPVPHFPREIEEGMDEYLAMQVVVETSTSRWTAPWKKPGRTEELQEKGRLRWRTPENPRNPTVNFGGELEPLVRFELCGLGSNRPGVFLDANPREGRRSATSSSRRAAVPRPRPLTQPPPTPAR